MAVMGSTAGKARAFPHAIHAALGEQLQKFRKIFRF
jgi:hypothetical protein